MSGWWPLPKADYGSGKPQVPALIIIRRARPEEKLRCYYDLKWVQDFCWPNDLGEVWP